MNKAFEEILSRLEDLKLPFPDKCYFGTTNDLIEEAKKVVQKVAEEYKKKNYFNLDHVALHKCPKCGGNAQHRVNNRGSWACGCFNCRLFKSNYDHQKAIQGWEDYCKEYSNGWIPCSERMPETGGQEVLATLESGYGLIRVTAILTGNRIGTFLRCNHREFDMKNWNIIAWQPLPEPYKERE